MWVYIASCLCRVVAWACRGRGGAAARNSMHGRLACVASRACAPSTRPYVPRWFSPCTVLALRMVAVGTVQFALGGQFLAFEHPAQLFCPCSCSSPQRGCTCIARAPACGCGGCRRVQRRTMRRRACGVLTEGRQGVSRGASAVAWRTSASVSLLSAPPIFVGSSF